MTQGERVKVLRKTLGLTLEKFGKKVGVGKTAISRIEKNERGITEQMAKSICREFNANYDWLIKEEGDPFSGLPQTILDDLCLQYECDDIDRLLIECYLRLNVDERQTIKKYIQNLSDSMKTNKNSSTNNIPKATVTDAESAYIKSRSRNVQKKDSSASNTTAESARTGTDDKSI